MNTTGELFFCGADAAAERADRRTFELLYRKIGPRLYGFVHRSEPREAEDICAEVWVTLLKYIPKFRGDAEGFEDLAYKIARRRLIDHRRRRTFRASDLTEMEGLPERFSHDEPEAAALERLRTSAVYKYLVATLPPDQVDVVLLRVLHDLSAERVAAILGITAGNVRIRHHRALAKLRTSSLVGEAS